MQNNELKTVELSSWQYLMLPDSEWHTALSDHYFKSVIDNRGEIYGLMDGEQIVSYAIVVKEKESIILEYIYTGSEFRRKGYGEELIRQIICEVFPDKSLCMHLAESFPLYERLLTIAERIGFCINSISSVISVALNEDSWETKNARMFPQIKKYLIRNGAECISFSQMDDNIRQQLMRSPESDFQNSMDPAPFLLNKEKGLDEELSFVLVRSGILKAYVLISRHSFHSICVEQIAENAREIGNGSILAPIISSLECIKQRPYIRQMDMNIHEKNKRSRSLAFSLAKGNEVREVKNVHMTLRKSIVQEKNIY